MSTEAPSVDHDGTGRTYSDLVESYNAAVDNLKRAAGELDRVEDNPSQFTDEQIVTLREQMTAADAQCKRLDHELKTKEVRDRSRQQFTKIESRGGPIMAVREPDMYVDGGRSFFTDLFWSTQNSPGAAERISKHHNHEIEKRGEQFAITSSTLGGIIPPAYLIDLYAKASRNGRVFADQCNGATLPDVGMSVVLPRLTTGTAAGIQATENSALTTQDVVEADLSVPVRTIGGYNPVSRQAIERAAYSDTILFEDLVARYWASLDSGTINGLGSAGTILGLLQTASISSSTASTATVAGVWPKIADVIQQINVATGGLGFVADKIVMHPRRWGFFEAAIDTTNRPIFGVSGQPDFNVLGEGSAAGYGYVGRMHGLPVFVDANIPTNTGATTNQDSIIVMASSVVHLFERTSDPVTLAFEQTSGTALTVNLICYGYAAFTAGRYPAASGAVTGQGLVPPTF